VAADFARYARYAHRPSIAAKLMKICQSKVETEAARPIEDGYPAKNTRCFSRFEKHFERAYFASSFSLAKAREISALHQTIRLITTLSVGSRAVCPLMGFSLDCDSIKNYPAGSWTSTAV